jgi:hypothetical protein
MVWLDGRMEPQGSNARALESELGGSQTGFPGPVLQDLAEAELEVPAPPRTRVIDEHIEQRLSRRGSGLGPPSL